MEPESARSLKRVKFGGDFQLDLSAYELRRAGRVLKLERIPMEILRFLIEQKDQLVNRAQIVERIWGKGVFLDTDNSINGAIRKIRHVLKDNPQEPRFIQTVTGRGYRFIAPVVLDDASEVRPQLDASPRRRSKSDPRGIRAMAVLPLENISGDRSHDYLADGMTEALITNLAKIKALRVISRTSAMQYKAGCKSLPEIARELNVDAVIEGSVLRLGKRVRIDTQLIHASSDQLLWAESYDRDFRDILSLQSEIARQVADEVRIILTPEERARLGSARQVNPEAHELYLKARYHWNKRTEESVTRALSYFRRAIDTDPTYAQGYAGLADSYNILGYYNALSPMEAYPKGKAAALKALELDNAMAEPHAALGVVKRDFEWDWTGAEEEFQRAINLNPGCVDAYHWRGTLFSMLGRHEQALCEKKRALEIDPLSVVIKTDLARMFYFCREYDQSLEKYHAALEMDPNFSAAHIWLAHAYQQKGLFEQAISELRAGLRLSSDSTFALARLGYGYAIAGRRGEAHAVLDRMKAQTSQKYVSPYDMAIVHLGLREDLKAFAWLQKALQERSIWLGYLNVEPQLDPLRSDQRFRTLVRSVGLPITA